MNFAMQNYELSRSLKNSTHLKKEEKDIQTLFWSSIQKGNGRKEKTLGGLNMFESFNLKGEGI